MSKLTKTTLLFVILFCFATSDTATAQEKLVLKASFETRLKQLLDTLETRGYEALKDFIHPQTGLYVTYGLGAYPAYRHHYAVGDFVNWYRSDYPNPAPKAFCKSCALASYALKQNLPPYFDLICSGEEEETPDEHVLYVDDTANQTYLTGWFLNYSRVMTANFDFDQPPVSDATLNEIAFIESNSYRVAALNHEFIIYMTLIDHEWHLTVLAAINCDA